MSTKDEVISDASVKRMRHGKTAKDKRTGAWSARLANREARATWQNDSQATNATFPGTRGK